MSPPNLGQQTAEARREIDFRDTILINITLVYWYVSENVILYQVQGNQWSQLNSNLSGFLSCDLQWDQSQSMGSYQTVYTS